MCDEMSSVVVVHGIRWNPFRNMDYKMLISTLTWRMAVFCVAGYPQARQPSANSKHVPRLCEELSRYNQFSRSVYFSILATCLCVLFVRRRRRRRATISAFSFHAVLELVCESIAKRDAAVFRGGSIALFIRYCIRDCSLGKEDRVHAASGSLISEELTAISHGDYSCGSVL